MTYKLGSTRSREVSINVINIQHIHRLLLALLKAYIQPINPDEPTLLNEIWGVAYKVERTGWQIERFLCKTALGTATILELKSTKVHV